MAAPRTLWDVRKNESFIQDQARLSQEHKTLRELHLFLHHELALEPTEFNHEGGNIYFILASDLLNPLALLSTRRVPNFPPFKATYEVDSQNKVVWLKALELV